jgi:hypothetical protein
MVDETAFTPGGDIVGPTLQIASEGSIVYRADQDIDGQFELYSIPSPLFVDGFESGDTSRW